MNLDLRTMMVMLAVLTFLFSILLGLASMHARDIRGLRQWALASLLISIGFGMAYTQAAPPGNGWVIIGGASLVIAGASLQLLGIQAFKEEALQWRILLLAVVVATAQSFWFVKIHPDVNLRALINYLVLAAINFA